MSGFNLRSDWKDFDFRPIQVKGFSNPLVLKNLFNKLRGKKAKFSFYDAIRRDITDSLNRHIENVIKMDMNLICEVNGKGGEGKSMILVYIAKKIKDAQIKYQKFADAPVRFTFNINDSRKAINFHPNGLTIIQDEYNELIGESSQTTQTEFNNLVRSMRFTQKSLIISNIDYIYVKGIHFVLETFGFFDKFFKQQSEENMKTACLVRYVDDNHPSKVLYLGVAKIDVGEVLQKYRQSLEFKQKNWDTLEKHGGAISHTMDKEQRVRYAEVLLAIAIKGNWNGKKDELNNFFQDAKIYCDTYQKRMILTETMKLRKKKLENAPITFIKADIYGDPLGEFYDNYYREKINRKDIKTNNTLFEFAESIPNFTAYWIMGLPMSEIMQDLQISRRTASTLKDSLLYGKGIPKELQLQYCFENYFPTIIPFCERGGKKSEPDLWFKNHFGLKIGCGEVKIYDRDYKAETLFLDSTSPAKRLRPSFLWCKENRIRHFPLLFRNNKWKKLGNPYLFLIPIDINGDFEIHLNKEECIENYLYPKEFNAVEFFSKEYQKALIGTAINYSE
jgi:hypothetical protein